MVQENPQLLQVREGKGGEGVPIPIASRCPFLLLPVYSFPHPLLLPFLLHLPSLATLFIPHGPILSLSSHRLCVRA